MAFIYLFYVKEALGAQSPQKSSLSYQNLLERVNKIQDLAGVHEFINGWGFVMDTPKMLKNTAFVFMTVHSFQQSAICQTNI